MRYLNRIIFINSASISYAEIALDGNVHFIGTQGVGKSTILRSILFFYNADTLRLGISKEKRSFADYYLPYANSYMIYEVVKETGTYCIVAFKSQGKVCYRFIDTAFDKKWFIENDGNVFDSWDKIRANLDKARIDYTRKIDRYEEYRDILYGNNEGKKEFKKYAFLESRQYQNIPRTIQNVFLNSKLEAEFIKETIIHSLNEDDIVIKLDTYQYQLKDFEEQLKDIRQFRQPAVQTQALEVAELNTTIQYQEREKTADTLLLVTARQHALQEEPILQKAIADETAKKINLQAKLEDSRKRYDTKKDKIVSEISVFDDRLKTIKEKLAYYSRININEVQLRVGKKKDIEQKGAHLQSEKVLLSAQYQQTTQKYEALLKELENQQMYSDNQKQQEQLNIDASVLQQKEAVRSEYAGWIDAIRKQHQHKLSEASIALDQALARQSAAEVKRAEIRHRKWMETEIVQAKDDIAQFKNQIERSTSNISSLRGQLSTIQKQWDLEEDSRKDRYNREKEKAEEKLQATRDKLEQVTLKLETTKNSFYEWLGQNKPGWELNIGKVCHEDILFSNNLQPKITSAKEVFYGISVDLTQVNRQVKNTDDYELEQQQLTQHSEKLKTGWQGWSDEFEQETTKLHRKISAQLKEKKESIREEEYSSHQLQMKLQGATITLRDLTDKAAAEKQLALEANEKELDELKKETAQSREQQRKTNDELDKQVRAKEKEKELKIVGITEAAAAGKQLLADELAQIKATFEDRKQQVRQQQQQELQHHGADTQRLNEIERELGAINAELQFIERNRDIVAEYKKDKRELLDRNEAFKTQRSGLQQQLQTEEGKFNNLQASILEEVAGHNATINDLNLQVKQIDEDLEEYDTLALLEWFNPPVADAGANRTPAKRCKELVRQIKEAHYAIIEKINSLKEVINKFLSHFSSNNIFKFQSILIDKKEYLEFAARLQQFIEDDRIVEFERRVNERYASIIKLIGKETNELTSREGEIQKIITKINSDFTQNNTIAVGVIQKIELKMDESENKVVQVLKLIQQFNSESGFELGVANLFNQVDPDAKNKKAVDLLKQLIREIQHIRRDTISLSDSFELKFRIVENQNDTGWVERLANVGSEGTDVLVKAMINIMLLNVFKEGASKRFKDFKLHCMMDEIGRLHPVNVRGILHFASARNIWLINGSPTENDALAYRHIYKLEKDSKSVTRAKRILSQHSQA